MTADTPRSPAVPDQASAQLAQVRASGAQDGELLRLVLKGQLHTDSWLIGHHLLPALAGQARLVFTWQDGETQGTAHISLLPLTDGSAYACDREGYWRVMTPREAQAELAYIGYRYAPEDHWCHGFAAYCLDLKGDEGLREEGASGPGEGNAAFPGDKTLPDFQGAHALSPLQVAQFWAERTGQRPKGYATGLVDQLEAIGLEVIGKVFSTQGKLGL